MDIEKDIEKCETIDEVLKVIKKIGGVMGSRDIFYSFDDIKERIKYVTAGANTNLITRTFGLRKKIETLLLKQ